MQLYLFGLGFGIASAFTWWAFSIPVVINITIAEKDVKSALRSISVAATKVKSAIRGISVTAKESKTRSIPVAETNVESAPRIIKRVHHR